ncbi:peptidoglycan-binding domain-containing protein [Segnochrobactraceae bacterium EtOH-i3]
MRGFSADDFGPVRGVAGQLLGRVTARPVRTIAIAGGVVMVGLIIANAVVMQHERHPAPIYATRPFSTTTVAVGPRTGITTTRSPAATQTSAEAPPEPHVVIDGPAVEKARIAAIQDALSKRGLYAGSVDGRTGPKTASAIRNFETQSGFAPTGQPSPAVAQALGIDDAVWLSKAADDQAAAERTRIAKAQKALSALGYGPLKADGRPGNETVNAVQRFELDQGLPVTGNIDDRLLVRLLEADTMAIN